MSEEGRENDVKNKEASDEKTQILRIAEELLRENKVIYLDMLFKICRRRLKMDSIKIHTTIQQLYKEKILVNGSKMTKKAVLHHNFREKLFNYVKMHPGKNFSMLKKEIPIEIKSENNISSGFLTWHLNILVKFGFIKMVTLGNFNVYMEKELDANVGLLYFQFRKKITRDILWLIVKEGQLNQADVYSSIEENRGTVYYHLKNMLETELLYSDINSDTNATEVWINPDNRDIILKVLNNIDRKYDL